MTEADEPRTERDLLAVVWDSIVDLGEGLDEQQWATPTDLPGWTVKDCLSHVVGVERSLLGEPAPEVAVDHLDHVTSPFAAVMETWVEVRRPTPGSEVLEELRVVSERRLDAMRAMSDQQWEEVGWSPIGEVPHHDFMALRAFDCWMHEQDMRRAVDRPGHLAGPLAELAVARLGAGLGYVIGKRAQAPEGATVVVEVTGDGGATFALVVEGRARTIDVPPSEPTVTLKVDLETFCALGGGRWSSQRALAEGRVSVAGDADLAERILGNLAVTP